MWSWVSSEDVLPDGVYRVFPVARRTKLITGDRQMVCRQIFANPYFIFLADGLVSWMSRKAANSRRGISTPAGVDAGGMATAARHVARMFL